MTENKILHSFLVVCLFTLSFKSFGQFKVKGTVKDAANEVLPGVNIVLKGTNKGVSTDFNGNFELTNVATGAYTLQATFVGFTMFTKEISVNDDVVITITMQEDSAALDEVIITGVTNPRSKIASSVSVTTLRPSVITESAPRSTAEIFRTIPGIRSESSGGEGNSNIAVRGVPISSGGSKYVQLQEDGLPVLLYGDISFATADMFIRFDASVKNIEAIRGGSASTLSSNSPGGIINIISKNGKTKGGMLSTSFGLDYNNFRTDISYGGAIKDDLYFHVGGFYRNGEGVRDASFSGNNGGQFKFNITKEFENGYVKLYTKFLNDRAISYMPLPIQVTGTNSNPNWSDAPNFDATHGALQTPFLQQNIGLGADGQLRRSKVSDGMFVNSQSIGLDVQFTIADDWKIKNNGRYAVNNGNFVSPFPAQIANAGTIADSFGTGATLSYANSGLGVDTNSLVARIHMFDTELNSLNNFMNDFRISKKIDNLDITVGYFKSFQNLSTSWLWNSYLQEVSDNNARLINVTSATNEPLSENGLYAYGTPFWGNLHRNYDTQYNVSAPYFNVNLEVNEAITIDAGLRYDMGDVDGSFAGGTERAYDVNNDGNISSVESNVFAVDNANATAVNYQYKYLSYSTGVNYKFSEKQSVFARYSRGASAKADRILFAGLDYLDGDKINAKDFINQAELGYKQRFEKGAVYATAFYAQTTEEGGFEATSNSIIENDYKSLGLEVEGFYTLGDFNIRGALTYTNAEITSGANEGNTPRRQPDFIFNLMPSYNFGKHNVGLNVIGQTKSYAQDTNELVMPAFAIFNGFVTFEVAKGLTANLAANNIFDGLGVTEAEEGSITENAVNYVRARPLPGRSISLTLAYKF